MDDGYSAVQLPRSPGGGRGGTPLPVPPQVTSRLTAEEQRVIRQCGRESLLYRCLPLVVVGCGAVKAGHAYGLLTRHPVYGLGMKYGLAAFVGYFLGKLSYYDACRRKILATIPDSNLAHVLRRSQAGNTYEGFREMTAAVTSPVLDVQQPPGRSEDNGDFPSADHASEAASDGGPESGEYGDVPPRSRAVTTYEELQRRNRLQYYRDYQRNLARQFAVGQPETSPAASAASQPGDADVSSHYAATEPRDRAFSARSSGKYYDEGFE